jgi:hypothetical protein
MTKNESVQFLADLCNSIDEIIMSLVKESTGYVHLY